MSELVLAKRLTLRTQQLCLGLESGDADILELVTPTTAALLRWWFAEENCASRAFNFHPGQRQAILNTIVAHEVLGSSSLQDLYQQICPDELLQGGLLAEVSQTKHAHPKYCLKMATGTGKTWVLQTLLVWQVLNANAAHEEGQNDPRFTRRFLIVAPGLIVYERLLDAFLGKERSDGSGTRDASRSDLAVFGELFMPPAWRETILQFVANNTCTKHEIGQKSTGNGLVAICNWHLLRDAGEESDDWDENDSIEAPGIRPEAHVIAAQTLPLTPGRATGNALEVLDRRWQRGNALAHLAELPDLMVFNDEAHHIHSVKKEGEITEVEWQKSLMRLAEGRGQRFVQVDFSATPYNDMGSGKKARKVYFPHIVVDFDLISAMKSGLVKSLVLDKRRELGAMPLEALDFKAERDGDEIELSEGQRVMLRAGLHKLRLLEKDFAKIDPARHPKMLVVCEDTKVTPKVAEFLIQEGLGEDEVMSIDSGKKAELSEKEWLPVRERLFNVDSHATPRVIVSVLMLREGFDVNNICVIVPLRSSEAPILLEQVIGRGLRLMWRGHDYETIKQENRERIAKGEEPNSLIDVLSIIEHPAFSRFYDELMQEGLVVSAEDTETSATTSAVGDLVNVGLREGYERYDFAIPFMMNDAEEVLTHNEIDVSALPVFRKIPLAEMSKYLGRGDAFISQDLQSKTLFGDYRVDGAVMNVSGYNEWLSRMIRRIAQALATPLPGGNRVAERMPMPYWQTGSEQIAEALDLYVREYLFAEAFEPFHNEQWRILLLQPVLDHITQVFALAFHESQQLQTLNEADARHRKLSEVSAITMREHSAIDVRKCIYPRLSIPARFGGLEQAFIEWADRDASIEAFCKIHEQKHDFLRLRYSRMDGFMGHYIPDFLVRCPDTVYLVETKGEEQVMHPNVQRKLRAAKAWCERVNALPETLRDGRQWRYALLGETVFYNWHDRHAKLADLLSYASLPVLGDGSETGELF